MIVGIDIGGSTTDAVLLDQGEFPVVTIEANNPVAAAAGALGKLVADFDLSLDRISRIAATGSGARALPNNLLGRPVTKVDEFTAIGIGGTSLAGLKDALVVSLGKGTAIVSVRDNQIVHFGGTGVGGGTLLGLSKHILSISKLDTLEAMARRGDLSRIDLTVGDIAGGPLGDLPPTTTAANFGKLNADATPDDKALAIINMIAEVIGVMSFASARACNQRDIVLTGKLTRIFEFLRQVKQLDRLLGTSFVIPRHAEYATAIGAARSVVQA